MLALPILQNLTGKFYSGMKKPADHAGFFKKHTLLAIFTDILANL
jgi:hypothetical protein